MRGIAGDTTTSLSDDMDLESLETEVLDEIVYYLREREVLSP